MTEHEKWLRIAKLAGEHGVRYRTNAALEAFLAAVTDPPAPPGTTRAPADLRSALEAETIERCAQVADETWGDGPNQSYDSGATSDGWNMASNHIATAIRALAPTKGDVS